MIVDYSEYITEKASKGIVNSVYVENGLPLFKHDSVCPFCKQKIENVIHHKSKTDYPEWLWGRFDQSELVVQCPNCGWWEYSSGILKTYEDSDIDIPLEVLRKYINKDTSVIYNIDAHKMEELVRSVFSDFYPSCKVKAFGKTRDGEKDGLLIDNSGKQSLIQIKRRTKANATEGVEALRALIGTTVIEDNVRGCIFVSTADHFSKPAKDYASNVINKNIVDTFDLIDCKEFLRMADLVRDKLPDVWTKLLKL